MDAVLIALFIVFLGVLITFTLSKGKSAKAKYIYWGLCVMLFGAPLSFSIGLSYGLSYGFIVHNGWAGLIMFYIYPIFLIIGLCLFIKGILKKSVKN